MREVLRRQLPKIQAWGPVLIGIGVVLVALIALLAWRGIVRASPANMVKSVMEAAREEDDAAVRRHLSDASLADPRCGEWVETLTAPLVRTKTEVVDDESMGEEAKVYISVTHRVGSGEMAATRVPICAVREDGRWKIDLPATMSSNNMQIWVTVQTEAQ